MDKTRIGYGVLLARIMLWSCYIFFAGFLSALVYWHFDREAFNSVNVTGLFEAGFGLNAKVYTSAGQRPEKFIMMDELNHGMVYWLLFRGSFFFLVGIVILRKILKLLTSFKSIGAFYEESITQFNSMAKLGFALFIVSCFNFYYLNGAANAAFTIAFGPLAFSVACLVLAEIFKKGKLLQDDQKAIV